MNIPEEAVVAAIEAEHRWRQNPGPPPSRAEYMVGAAAPFIAAQVLNDALCVIETIWIPEGQFYGLEAAREAVNAVLRERGPE